MQGFDSHITLSGNDLLYYDNAAFVAQGDGWFEHLYRQLHWQQDTLSVAGRRIAIPRLQAWYGEHAYRYSGMTLAARPMPNLLQAILQQVQTLSGFQFNAVLANLYRNGRDSVGWHSDDEPELGKAPVIASLSLGAVRRFSFRPRYVTPGQRRQVQHLLLEHGSLLVMPPGMQQRWQHALHKEAGVDKPRINLTFRYIIQNATGAWQQAPENNNRGKE